MGEKGNRDDGVEWARQLRAEVSSGTERTLPSFLIELQKYSFESMSENCRYSRLNVVY